MDILQPIAKANRYVEGVEENMNLENVNLELSSSAQTVEEIIAWSRENVRKGKKLKKSNKQNMGKKFHMLKLSGESTEIRKLRWCQDRRTKESAAK